MTKDIVTRLTWLSAPRFSSIPVADTIAEARNEIITLRNRNKRLEHQVRVLQIANENLKSENLALDHERKVWKQLVEGEF